jgi:hypothetical protein
MISGNIASRLTEEELELATTIADRYVSRGVRPADADRAALLAVRWSGRTVRRIRALERVQEALDRAAWDDETSPECPNARRRG